MLQELLSTPALALPLALCLLLGLRLAADRLTPWRPRIEVSWGLRDLLIVCCLFFSALLLLQSMALSLLHPDEEKPLLPVSWASAIQMAAQVAGLLLIAVLAQQRHRGGARAALEQLGFRPQGNGRAVVLGLLAFAAAFPLVQGLYVVWAEIWSALRGEPLPTQETLERVRSVEAPLERAFVHFQAGFFAPFAEEIAWRGFVQPVLVRSLGALRGIALTALLFVVLGHGPEVYLPLFGFSLLLGWLYWRTGRLLAPIALHAALNLTTLFWPALFD